MTAPAITTPAVPAATTASNPPATPTSDPKLDDLYTKNPGTVDVKPPTPAVSSDATAGTATATTDTATMGSVPAAGDVSTQLNNITSQDSPYIKLARQQGMLSAARRGLGNSSIAAGNSESAAVAAAMPAAQQNAGQEFAQSRANQDASNAAAATNAELGTHVSETNASNQTDVSKQNAQLKTQTSQFNSSQDFAAKMANAASANDMRKLVLQQNADLNKQFLANSGAKDLATINGEFQTLISSNTAAGSLYDSYFNAISALMQNTSIDPGQMTTKLALLQSQLESGLKVIQSTQGIDWSAYTPGTPGGKPSPIGPKPIGGGGGGK